MKNYNLSEYQFLILKAIIKNMQEIEQLYKDAIKNDFQHPQYYVGRMSGHNIFNMEVLNTLINELNNYESTNETK
ncbi:MAG: hypothetical protein EBR30_21020 [Cytophagia bacterium]|nr:hypothetical protein [Cytophagia bacterium]NBW37449.1 hypothetical protein [Cytophagia bacterium]